MQVLLQLEAVAAAEAERLGRAPRMHEWAAVAGETDVAAFTARVQVPTGCRLAVQGCWSLLDTSLFRRQLAAQVSPRVSLGPGLAWPDVRFTTRDVRKRCKSNNLL